MKKLSIVIIAFIVLTITVQAQESATGVLSASPGLLTQAKLDASSNLFRLAAKNLPPDILTQFIGSAATGTYLPRRLDDATMEVSLAAYNAVWLPEATGSMTQTLCFGLWYEWLRGARIRGGEIPAWAIDAGYNARYIWIENESEIAALEVLHAAKKNGVPERF